MSEIEAPDIVVDAPPPPPIPDATRYLDGVTTSRLCLAAGEAGLIPILLARKVTEDDVKSRVARAAAVRQICAVAKQPELAAGLIANDADETAAKAAGGQIAELLELTINDYDAPQPRVMMAMAKMGAADESMPTPVSQGLTTISVSVSTRWRFTK